MIFDEQQHQQSESLNHDNSHATASTSNNHLIEDEQVEQNIAAVEIENFNLHKQKDLSDDYSENDDGNEILAISSSLSSDSDDDKQVTKFDPIRGQVLVDGNTQYRAVQQVLNDTIVPKDGDSNINSLTISKSSRVHVGNSITTNYQGPVTIIYSNSSSVRENDRDQTQIKEINEVTINESELANEEKEQSTTSSYRLRRFTCTKVEKWFLARRWCVVILIVIGILATITILCILLISVWNSKGSSSAPDLQTNITTLTPNVSSTTISTPKSTLSTSTLSSTTTTDSSINYDGLPIITKKEWSKLVPSEPLSKLEILPPPYVIIGDTYKYAPGVCLNQNDCTLSARRIEFKEHIHFETEVISWNFLIGGDGNVYEGRGWDIEGAHTENYNNKSIGIAFIGDFTNQEPTKVQLDVALKLLKVGKKNDKLTIDYKLLGARQVTDTKGPGDILYNIIKSWKHWISKP